MVSQLPMWIFVGAALIAIAFFIATVSKNPIAWAVAFFSAGVYLVCWGHKLWQLFMSAAHPG
jgi:hypothetical protein